jgi:hypothetical protein
MFSPHRHPSSHWPLVAAPWIEISPDPRLIPPCSGSRYQVPRQGCDSFTVGDDTVCAWCAALCLRLRKLSRMLRHAAFQTSASEGP